MEDNVQTIIMSLVAIVVFFIFPTYIAYEKKDDISYLLALEYTQSFVDTVRSKGYVSKKMYDDYLVVLSKTGNSYDVNLEHRRKKVEPVTNYFQGDKVVDYKNQESRDRTIEPEKNVNGTNKYSMVQNTYRMDEEVITGSQVVAIIEQEDFYQMNVGDEFTVVLKNTNTTLATIFYNLITIGGSDTNTRIYVNYGGSITNETWSKTKVYVEYEAPTVVVGVIAEILKEAESPDDNFDNIEKTYTPLTTYTNNFVIEFKAKPEAATEMPTEGSMALVPTAGLKKYNYLIPEINGGSGDRAGLGVSVGINGVTIILHANNYYYSVLSYDGPIIKYSDFKIVVKNMVPTLYIDGLKVSDGIAPPVKSGVSPKTFVFCESRVGKGFIEDQYYIGKAKDIKFYNIITN